MTKYTKKYIAAVEALQSICVEAFLSLLPKLRVGMSEKDIEHKLIHHLSVKNVTSFWYDIGVVVLIGEKRFHDMANPNYSKKRPSSSVSLNPGDELYIDLTPMDMGGVWGDFSSMIIFKPQKDDEDKVDFLKLIYEIHMEGIDKLTSSMTGADVCTMFNETYNQNNITLEDARNTVGHTLATFGKKDAGGNDKRVFLEMKNKNTIAEVVLAIEPGGFTIRNNKELVGRFEDCVYIPKTGKSIILGRKQTLPIFVN